MAKKTVELSELSDDELIAKQQSLTEKRQEVRAQALEVQAELDRRSDERPNHPDPDAQSIGS